LKAAAGSTTITMKVFTFVYFCCAAVTVALIVGIVLVVLAIDGR
jgi:hypothetical protein